MDDLANGRGEDLVFAECDANLPLFQSSFRRRALRPVFVVVLFGHVILRDFTRAHFALIRVRSVFHTAHDSGLKGLPFLQQFACALGIHVLNYRSSAKVPAASSSSRRTRAALQLHRFHVLAAKHDLLLASGYPACHRLTSRLPLWCLLLRVQFRFGFNFLPASGCFLLLRFFRHVCAPPLKASLPSAAHCGHSNRARQSRSFAYLAGAVLQRARCEKQWLPNWVWEKNATGWRSKFRH